MFTSTSVDLTHNKKYVNKYVNNYNTIQSVEKEENFFLVESNVVMNDNWRTSLSLESNFNGGKLQ